MADATKKMRRLLAELEKQGATSRRLKAGGWIVYPPNSTRTITLHNSPSARHSSIRLRNDVETAGMTWPKGFTL